jgi:phage shock protein A
MKTFTKRELTIIQSYDNEISKKEKFITSLQEMLENAFKKINRLENETIKFETNLRCG